MHLDDGMFGVILMKNKYITLLPGDVVQETLGFTYFMWMVKEEGKLCTLMPTQTIASYCLFLPMLNMEGLLR